MHTLGPYLSTVDPHYGELDVKDSESEASEFEEDIRYGWEHWGDERLRAHRQPPPKSEHSKDDDDTQNEQYGPYYQQSCIQAHHQQQLFDATPARGYSKWFRARRSKKDKSSVCSLTSDEEWEQELVRRGEIEDQIAAYPIGTQQAAKRAENERRRRWDREHGRQTRPQDLL